MVPGHQADSSFSPTFSSEEPPSPPCTATPSPGENVSPTPCTPDNSATQPDVQVTPQVAESTTSSVDEGGGDGDGGGAPDTGSAQVDEEEVEVQEIEQEEEKPHVPEQPQLEQEEEKKEPEEQEREATCTGGAGRRPSLHHTASPIRVQRNGTCCHSTTSDYELSLDLKNKQVGSKALWDCGLGYVWVCDTGTRIGCCASFRCFEVAEFEV